AIATVFGGDATALGSTLLLAQADNNAAVRLPRPRPDGTAPSATPAPANASDQATAPSVATEPPADDTAEEEPAPRDAGEAVGAPDPSLARLPRPRPDPSAA